MTNGRIVDKAMAAEMERFQIEIVRTEDGMYCKRYCGFWGKPPVVNFGMSQLRPMLDMLRFAAGLAGGGER